MEDLPDFTNLEFVDYYISETDLIKRLVISQKDGTINNRLFDNLIRTPINDDEVRKYLGFYIGMNISRKRMGFVTEEKPGDFDIIVIPYDIDKVYFDRTCAIEVKVVRPKRMNPRKAPTSYGISQLQGIIRDGFPLVGLIHICMPEPLKPNEKQIFKYNPIGVGEGADHISNEEFFKSFIDIKVDTFSMALTENQMKKLLSKDIPKYVGLCTVGLNVSKDDHLIITYDFDFNAHYESGYFNPHKKESTIELIKDYFKNNKDSLLIAKNPYLRHK